MKKEGQEIQQGRGEKVKERQKNPAEQRRTKTRNKEEHREETKGKRRRKIQ